MGALPEKFIFRRAMSLPARSMKWLPRKRSGRLICTILQVRLQKGTETPKIVVEEPWTDVVPVKRPAHPSLAALEKVHAWKADLEQGRVRSLAALARREGITTARASQLMGLTRLTPEVSMFLGDVLPRFRGAKETFSLRRLLLIAALPDEKQIEALQEKVGSSVVRRRSAHTDARRA